MLNKGIEFESCPIWLRKKKKKKKCGLGLLKIRFDVSLCESYEGIMLKINIIVEFSLNLNW